MLERADGMAALQDQRLGRWLAWPAVKGYIYGRLFADVVNGAGRSADSLLRRWLVAVRLPGAALRFARELRTIGGPGTLPRVAWLVDTFGNRGPDGTVRDAIFDELPAALGGQVEHFFISAPVGAGPASRRLLHAVEEFASRCSALYVLRPDLRAAARTLAATLNALAPGKPAADWRRIALTALAAFEARRALWRAVFARAQPRALVVTDAAYRTGEVAAAKELGIPVVEFQHGLFGPHCPEYGWPGSLAPQRDRMPLADRLFVFGELFRAAALKKGFWRPEQVRVVGCRSIERHRDAGAAHAPGVRTRLLFFTQATSRGEAVAFWREYLGRVAAGEFADCELSIKLHPAEAQHEGEYRALAQQHPGRCAILPVDADALYLMQRHDIVVSYTSNALVEAIALGRPAVSLAGQQVPGGIFGLCPIDEAKELVPAIASPQALAQFVAAPGSRALAAFTATSTRLYADGFERAAPDALLSAMGYT